MLNLRPFEPSGKNEILQFAQANPWKPIWSEIQMNEFLQRLISSHSCIFDIFRDETRVATGVLLDKVQNKGNHACLEFLGIDSSASPVEIYSLTLQKAQDVLPVTRAGIELTLHSSHIGKDLEKLILQEEFLPYYETFEMVAPSQAFPNQSTNRISLLTEAQYEECYLVTSQAFADNLDICIPNFEDWKSSRQESQAYQTWIYQEDKKIVGFLNVLVDRDNPFGEIRTLGVLPSYRGRGVGKKLLSFALDLLAQNLIPHCRLTVASQNAKALRLYHDLGFGTIDQYQVFCLKTEPHHK